MQLMENKFQRSDITCIDHMYCKKQCWPLFYQCILNRMYLTVCINTVSTGTPYHLMLLMFWIPLDIYLYLEKLYT